MEGHLVGGEVGMTMLQWLAVQRTMSGVAGGRWHGSEEAQRPRGGGERAAVAPGTAAEGAPVPAPRLERAPCGAPGRRRMLPAS